MKKIFTFLLFAVLATVSAWADDLAIATISPAAGAELETMPNISVTFNNPGAVGYVWYEIIDLNPADAENACLQAGELKKQTDGSWATKYLQMYDIKLYQGHEYSIKFSTWAKEDDKNQGGEATAVLTSNIKGTTKQYQFAAAELSLVTPSSGSTIVSGEITAVFTAPVETLSADITTGVGGGNVSCQVTKVSHLLNFLS